MPITKWRYNSTGDRSEVVKEINECRSRGGLAVDFGGAKKTLDGLQGVDLVVDQAKPEWDQKRHLYRNLNDFGNQDVRDITELRYYLRDETASPFDWAICTHTLEDLDWPGPLLRLLPQCAKRGYIAVPSIYFELMQVHGTLGFIHHRTVWEVLDGVLVGWWKIPFLLADEIRHKVDEKAIAGYNRGDRELEVWWEGDLPFGIEPLGPSMEVVKEKYHQLIERI
jgi:hypothetical protein